jgi:uncharacterized membrane protein
MTLQGAAAAVAADMPGLASGCAAWGCAAPVQHAHGCFLQLENQLGTEQLKQ